ncbi:MAG TPA: beta-1,6-N-acetylglucosaminyltransferase [Acidimicrobiales bacterium]|nr:beta-1,6-N-acetylglucosaminyltransferase [Acidimicrobiales bacterium]
MASRRPPVTDNRRPRVAYLVMSHKNPAQVESLVTRILELSPAGEVVVHHDTHESADATPLWNGSPPARVRLVDPVAVSWGDWSVVEATLRLLRVAVDEIDSDWFVLLSGEDRPVRDLAAWEDELVASGTDGLVPMRPLTVRPAFGRRPSADDLNFVRYAFRWRAVPARYVRGGRYVLEAARRISRYVQPVFKIEYAERRGTWMVGRWRRRRLPDGWTLYCGSQWMALGRRAVTTLLASDAAVTEWFRQTWIPDQGFFHTVLGNAAGFSFSTQPLTYVVPHDTHKGAAWMVLRSDDVGTIALSGAAFARKFDPAVDREVIDLVDAAVDASVAGTARGG